MEALMTKVNNDIIQNNQIIFSNSDIEKFIKSFNTKNLINRQKKEYIHKLRNNWYCFSDIRNSQNELFSIAKKFINHLISV